jgi:DNA-binding response OmpR family regulator
MRIAILEDDLTVADLVRVWLAGAGHSCHTFHLGRELMRAMTRDTFDLLVLDWELPDVNGDKVLEWVRENVRDNLPVLFTTGRVEEQDIVSALKKGADDYLVKPLRKDELLARVEALGRRAKPQPRLADVLKVGDFEIDLGRRRVQRAGRAIELTQKDFDLAVFLFRNVGHLVSRGHILESVWGRSADLNTRTVDTHVSRLRSKLGLVPEQGWRLTAVYQHGYRLETVTGDAANGSADTPEQQKA